MLENWKLVRQRAGRIPTVRGCLVLLLGFAVVAAAAIRLVHPFLAVTERARTGVLVIEGWAPDFVMVAGLEEFRRGGYRELYATGGPLDRGHFLSEHGSNAEVGRATLERLGAPKSALRAVPAPKVRRDRTFAAAVALRDWMRQHGRSPEGINVVTNGAHARRTRLLFELAFGGRTKIGIIAVPDEQYDAARWWRSSNGVRDVCDESIAYLYARFLFRFSDDLGND